MTDKTITNNRARTADHVQKEAIVRRWKIVGRVFGVSCCLLSMAVGTIFGNLYWNSRLFRDLVNERGVVGLLADTITGDPLANWTVERQFPMRDSINLLVMGVDKDYDRRGKPIENSNGRSDTILLARVDFYRKTISAISIPRDTAVQIPGYRGVWKANAAHSLGGPKLASEMIQSVFGVQPEAWVTLNFEGFQKVVDAVGGVELDVEKKLDYDDNWGKLHIHLKPGIQHLTGYEAMGYVRMRHSDSDLMRAERQQKFLEALRARIKSKETFLKLPEVINSLDAMLKREGLTDGQLFALLNFARQLPRENIQMATMPSRIGGNYVVMDEEKTAEVIRSMFFPDWVTPPAINAPRISLARAMGRGSRQSARKPAAATTATPAETSPEEPLPLETPAEEPTQPAEPMSDPGAQPAGPGTGTPAPPSAG